MPRPSVTFPYDGALFDVDRQLLANGITTEFHGVTLSWEGGLRGEAYAERMFDALERMHPIMGARHYVHLRFETHHVGGLDIARQWIRDGRVRFLALNDHLPSMARRLGDERKLMQYANRAECDLDIFQDRIRAAMAAADSVADAMRELTACAREAGSEAWRRIDDPDASTRRYYHQLGCGVAEFPLTREAASVARDLGNSVVFGAPNVVRGGSHTGAPSATDMVRAGLCDVLTSDYYYPAPLTAALRLAAEGVPSLPQASGLRCVAQSRERRRPQGPRRAGAGPDRRCHRGGRPRAGAAARVRGHRGRRIALRQPRLRRRPPPTHGGLTMPLAHRYALYLAPTGPWREHGSRWLGRCADTGEALPPLPGLPGPGRARNGRAGGRAIGWTSQRHL